MSLKEKLTKIGAKVVSHGRYVAFQMAEVAIHGKRSRSGAWQSCGRSHQRRCVWRIRHTSRNNLFSPNYPQSGIVNGAGKSTLTQRS